MPVDVVTTVAPVVSVVKATAARAATVVLAVPVAVVATTVAATPAVVLPAATTPVPAATAPPLVVEPPVVLLAARVARTSQVISLRWPLGLKKRNVRLFDPLSYRTLSLFKIKCYNRKGPSIARCKRVA